MEGHMVTIGWYERINQFDPPLSTRLIIPRIGIDRQRIIHLIRRPGKRLR